MRKLFSVLLLAVTLLGLAANPALAAASVQDCTFTVADDNTIISTVCAPAPRQSVVARWGYCNVTANETYITFFDNQGYCGSRVQMNPPAPGQCRLMGQWDNWAGSLSDNGRGETFHYDTSYCGGAVLPTVHHQDIPDLYQSGFGNKITSIEWE